MPDKTVPQFDPLQFALGRTYAGNIASVAAVDKYTVAITMDRPHALFPGLLPQIMLISPCNAEALKYDRDALMFHPSGTGPYRVQRLVAHERLELLRNAGYWDRGRIEQVMTNLLTNAIKYGKGSPIEVAVASRGNAAVLAVSDQGIGISRTDQARIFERFERAVSSKNFGGLGLGLWIASQLVEAHSGTIRVTSELGKGATFEVALPVITPVA